MDKVLKNILSSKNSDKNLEELVIECKALQEIFAYNMSNLLETLQVVDMEIIRGQDDHSDSKSKDRTERQDESVSSD